MFTVSAVILKSGASPDTSHLYEPLDCAVILTSFMVHVSLLQLNSWLAANVIPVVLNFCTDG